MRSIIALALALSALAPLAGSGAAVAADPFPHVIALPNGFRPEGIAIGRGTTFYTGSLGGQGIYRGDVRTGEGATLVSGGGPYTGMKVDEHDRLWVAGANSGRGYVFGASDGAAIATFTFASSPTFINDVVVTQRAAYFTDSQRPALYRVAIAPDGEIGALSTVDLTGRIQFVTGFNLNGIDATPDGKTLVVVNSTTGKLYAIDTTTHDVTEIDLGGATVTQGDGILLHGKTLYVVRNRSNQIAVVELEPDLASGSIARTITDGAFDVPTTIARFGNALYAVNARFGTTPTPTTAYAAVRVDR